MNIHKLKGKWDSPLSKANTTGHLPRKKKQKNLTVENYRDKKGMVHCPQGGQQMEKYLFKKIC